MTTTTYTIDGVNYTSDQIKAFVTATGMTSWSGGWLSWGKANIHNSQYKTAYQSAGLSGYSGYNGNTSNNNTNTGNTSNNTNTGNTSNNNTSNNSGSTGSGNTNNTNTSNNTFKDSSGNTLTDTGRTKTIGSYSFKVLTNSNGTNAYYAQKSNGSWEYAGYRENEAGFEGYVNSDQWKNYASSIGISGGSGSNTNNATTNTGSFAVTDGKLIKTNNGKTYIVGKEANTGKYGFYSQDPNGEYEIKTFDSLVDVSRAISDNNGGIKSSTSIQIPEYRAGQTTYLTQLQELVDSGSITANPTLISDMAQAGATANQTGQDAKEAIDKVLSDYQQANPNAPLVDALEKQASDQEAMDTFWNEWTELQQWMIDNPDDVKNYMENITIFDDEYNENLGNLNKDLELSLQEINNQYSQSIEQINLDNKLSEDQKLEAIKTATDSFLLTSEELNLNKETAYKTASKALEKAVEDTGNYTAQNYMQLVSNGIVDGNMSKISAKNFVQSLKSYREDTADNYNDTQKQLALSQKKASLQLETQVGSDKAKQIANQTTTNPFYSQNTARFLQNQNSQTQFGNYKGNINQSYESKTQQNALKTSNLSTNTALNTNKLNTAYDKNKVQLDRWKITNQAQYLNQNIENTKYTKLANGEFKLGTGETFNKKNQWGNRLSEGAFRIY